MTLVRVLSAAILVTAVATPADLLWKAGAAKVAITPRDAVWMAGYSARKQQSDGADYPLQAKALALADNSGHRIVLVTTDLLGLTGKVAAAVSERAARQFGIRREDLLLNSSHTHSGPVIDDMLSVAYDLSPQQWNDIALYTRELENKLVEVIGEATRSMVPAQLRFGHSSAGFAANRRTSFNPNGPVDHDVPVLRVDDAAGKMIAVAFGYACHNTTIGAEHCHFNGDYAGYAQAALDRAHAGSVALFVTGCGADANPAPRGTPELARQHGEKLAASVDGVLQQLRPVRGPMATAFGIVQLKFATPPTREELVKRLADPNEYVRRHARLLLRNLAHNESLQVSYPDPVQIWRFGPDLTLVAMGGEVVVDYALRLKQQYGAERLWAVGYSNDVFGYVPSLRVLKEGGYEGGGAMMYYGQTGPFDNSVEESIFAKIAELMKKVTP